MDRNHRTIATVALWLATAVFPEIAEAQTATDHRGNRIENFRQSGVTLGGHRNAPLACTGDGGWCADLVWSAPDAKLTLVVVPPADRSSPSPTHVYVLPPNLLDGGGVSLWDRIIIEADGGVMVGLDISKVTQRPGFRSVQRRLLLLRVGPDAGDRLVPVLEAPLSGNTEVAVCSTPQTPESYVSCTNQFVLSSLFTLVPNISPARLDLVMVVTAYTAPDRRFRSEEARDPVERLEGDEVADPECTYTRSFYFDEEAERFLPDAPLPACPEFLQP